MKKLIVSLTGVLLVLVGLLGPTVAAQDIRRSLSSVSTLLVNGAGSITKTGVNCTAVNGADGGAYFYVCNGSVNVNSAALNLLSGGTAKIAIAGPTVDGQVIVTNGAATTGVGLDVATDGILKVKNRAQTTDATIQAGVLQTSAAWLAGVSSSNTYFGDPSLPSRVRTNFATPGSLTNGDWWVESDTGAVTGASGALKAQLNGATVYVTPAIRRVGRFNAQNAAKASVAAYTVGSADGSFEVSANVLVTTATTHTFTVTCTYTDEGNTSRTVTLNFSLVAGGALTTSIVNTNGAVPYMGMPIQIRAKAATTITIATTGTFTTVTYNVEGTIKQTA